MSRTKTEETAETVPAIDLSLLDNDQEIAAEDIILAEADVPQKVKDFVNRSHEYWKTNPERWRRVILASAEAVTEVKKHAGKYARSTGRTFRTKNVSDPNSLVYRVSDRVREDNNGQN